MEFKSKRFYLVVLGVIVIALQKLLKLDPSAIDQVIYIIMAYIGGETLRPTGTKDGTVLPAQIGNAIKSIKNKVITGPSKTGAKK